MIKFRQKDFVLPAFLAPLFTANGLMTASMIGGTAISAVQGSKAAKASEEQHEQMLAAQKRENAKLTKALNNLAEQAKNNPQSAIQAGQMVGQSRMYAIPSGAALNGFFKKVGQLGKDMIGAVGGKKKVGTGKFLVDKKTGKKVEMHKYVPDTGVDAAGKAILGLGSAGVATAAVGYGVNKFQTEDARKIGMLPPKETQKSYSVMSSAGSYAKRMGKHLVSKENLKKSASWGAWGVLPLAGYLGDRAQFKDQIKNQEQQAMGQKQYSMATAARGFIKNLNPKTWQIVKTPKDTLSGFAAKSGSMFMIGKKEMLGFGERLKKNATSDWGRKTGEWITKKDAKGNYKNLWKANLGIGLTGGSVLTAAYGKSEKLADKALRKVDSDAYSYENYKNNQQQ